MLRFRTREASRRGTDRVARRPVLSNAPSGDQQAPPSTRREERHGDARQICEFPSDAWLSVWPATLRRPFFAPPPICRAQQYRAPAVIAADPFRPTGSRGRDVDLAVLPDHRSEAWPLVNPCRSELEAGRPKKPTASSQGFFTSCVAIRDHQQLNSHFGVAAHGACCAASRVCLGGGSSCWPPLCLSRSSPDAVTPPSPNLMGRPRRNVRSRSRACPSRFPLG